MRAHATADWQGGPTQNVPEKKKAVGKKLSLFTPTAKASVAQLATNSAMQKAFISLILGNPKSAHLLNLPLMLFVIHANGDADLHALGKARHREAQRLALGWNRAGGPTDYVEGSHAVSYRNGGTRTVTTMRSRRATPTVGVVCVATFCDACRDMRRVAHRT